MIKKNNKKLTTLDELQPLSGIPLHFLPRYFQTTKHVLYKKRRQYGSNLLEINFLSIGLGPKVRYAWAGWKACPRILVWIDRQSCYSK